MPVSLSHIVFSCGHDGMIELPTNDKEREKQLAYYQNKASCPDCYAKIVAERDENNSKGCSKIKMLDEKYKTEFSDCKYTKVGIKTDNERFVFVPNERIAAEALLKVLGIGKSSTDYKEQYNKAISDYLLRKTDAARRKLLIQEDIPDETKSRLSAAFDIIDRYQELVNKQSA